MMKLTRNLLRSLLATAIVLGGGPGVHAMDNPNIILIFADDMGIDCVSAFNDELGVRTPHIDRLAAEGMSFMDAHTTSAVCSPSRYGLLTGRYNWRSRLKRGIVGKWERPLIEEGRMTIPSLLKDRGYDTAMIGKWHLGFHWPKRGGGMTSKASEIDFTQPITGGPNAIGFDYWFGDDVPNWPPYAWRENERLLGEISTTSQDLGLTDYVGVNPGPAVEDWRLEDVLPEYARRCSEFVRNQADNDAPFFLYFSMPSPHTPIAPNDEWKGRSGISPYVDFLLETDWAVGELLNALDATGQAEETLVIFTTDNGTSPQAKFEDLKSKGVNLTANWRGNKADIYEGGHRVPFIVRWPGYVEGGGRSDELISVADTLATLADVVGAELPENAGEDSVSLAPILFGESVDRARHEAVICHSISGHFAVRTEKWKLMFCHGSGGWSAPTEAEARSADAPPIQLYDLERDPKESRNVYAENPEVAKELTSILRRYIENGRSTPGAPQRNHGGTVHWENMPWPRPAFDIATAQQGNFPERRTLTIHTYPEDGRLELPTPFPNIVRATALASGKALRWSFNQDASEIHLHLPDEAVSRVELMIAENSGPQADGAFVLSALDANVVGSTAKLETHPGNHRIGFWVDDNDYVTWDEADSGLPKGRYGVELVYSRAGSPGAEAVVQINGQELAAPLTPTGSWYVYQTESVGSVQLEADAALRVAVRSVKANGPVMNLKAIALSPIKNP